jgi:FlaA1/EpsC-like NDP-sugar epimerase
LDDIGRLVDARRIQEVIIAIPSAPGRVVRQVTESCQQKGVLFRTMPGIYELIGGKINVGRLREVEITDLLRRAPVQIDENLIGTSLSGRRVMITGAGGSIGRELCRQVARWGPTDLTLLGHGENSVFETLIDLEEISLLPLSNWMCVTRPLISSTASPQVVFTRRISTSFDGNQR